MVNLARSNKHVLFSWTSRDMHFVPQAEEAKVKISEVAGERVDNEAKLKVIRQEEEAIKKEKLVRRLSRVERGTVCVCLKLACVNVNYLSVRPQEAKKAEEEEERKKKEEEEAKKLAELQEAGIDMEKVVFLVGIDAHRSV